MKRNERGISLIVLVIAIVLMAVLVAVGVVLIVNKDQSKRENKKSEVTEEYDNLEKFYVANEINIYYDEEIWEEEKNSDLGQTYKLLIHKDTELTLGVQAHEDFSDEYNFSDEKEREEFYNYLFSEAESIEKSEQFEKLNSNFYYIFIEQNNSIFEVSQRTYVVVDAQKDIAYIFLIAADEFTEELEEDIIELLETIK